MLLGELVLGNTIEAQAYCFVNDNCRLVNTSEPVIFPFETLDRKYLNTDNKKELYLKLLFMNSMLGKIIFTDIPDSIHVSENSCNIIYGPEKFTIGFQHCKVFDTSGLKLLDAEQLTSQPHVKVVDLFQARSIKREYDFACISTGDSFVSTIWPHNSGRISGSRYVTEFFTESHIPSTQVGIFDFSETMARFKLAEHLKESRFIGTISGLNDCGEKTYNNISLTHIERHIIRPNAVYRDTSCVKFSKLTLEEILLETKKRES